MKQQETIDTIDFCYIEELKSIVDRGNIARCIEYVKSNPDCKLKPIDYWLDGAETAVYELYEIASRLCGCIGQIALDDKHEWDEDDITALQSLAELVHIPPIERSVTYTVDISDVLKYYPRIKTTLDTIYSNIIFLHEQDFIKTYLNRCLLHLNDADEELDWKITDLRYEGDKGRIRLYIDATRAGNNDNAND